MLWVDLAEAVYGILSFLSHLAFGTNLGIELEQYGFASGTYGTQYETNLFVSYTACCVIMFLVFVLRDQPGMDGGLRLHWWQQSPFQATEATMLAFTWIHIGLLAAAVAILQQQPHEFEACVSA